MTNIENLTLAISNYIKKEIMTEMPVMLTCALSDEMERIDAQEIASEHIIESVNENMPCSDKLERLMYDFLQEKINEEIDDVGDIAAAILEEKIEREFLDFEDMAREQIKRLDFDEMSKECIEEVIAQKIDSIEETLMPDLSETLCTLIEESSRVRTAIKKATKEEFKNLLKPVYKNLKSLYFDIFNR